MSVGEIKPGFVALVRRIKAPVYPVGIAGAHEAFPRHTLLIRPRKVRVVFGKPFTPEEVEELSQRGRELDFARLVHERLTECCEDAERWRQR